MNERIKKLLNEATSGHEQEHDRSKVMTVSDKEMDKFAELIVKECIDWCNANARDDGTAQRIAEDIKKDFGVEE
jgi:hypothetical protein